MNNNSNTTTIETEEEYFDPLEGYSGNSTASTSNTNSNSARNNINNSNLNRLNSSTFSQRQQSSRRSSSRERSMGGGQRSYSNTSRRDSYSKAEEELIRSRAPLSPPEDDYLYETQDEFVNSRREIERTDGWHHLPLALVLVPPLGAIVHGRAENWTDGIILVLICFYLYQLIKVPWDTYYASHGRYVLDESIQQGDQDEATKAKRRHSSNILRRAELLSLSATIFVPVIGSGILYFARSILSDPDRYINRFTISLFALATSIKPVLHLSKLIKNNSLYHMEAVWYPSTEVHLLRRRVDSLERDISQLSRAFATKDDVRNLRDGVDIPLSQLSKAVRRFDKKEEYLRLSSEERFALLDYKLEKAAQELASNVTLIERLRQEHDTALHPLTTLLKVLKHVAVGHSQMNSNSEDHMKWSQRGILWYIFLPLNVSNSAIDWVSSSTKSLTAIAYGEEGNVNGKHRESKTGKRIGVA